MAVPTLDIRVNFDRGGVSRLTNDGFETNTTGWSVSAGIQSAGTSITRTVSAPYMGVAVGRLVTTSTNGSGVKFVLSGTFSSGVAYRFRVFLKSISGTTSALIRIGSLGTAGDRATTTMTLTTSWVSYQVDFTPSADRSDVQVNVTNNAASVMTADIDDAEVYAVRDDVTGIADMFTYTHGANFEGGIAAGQCTLRLRNETTAYTSGATAVVPGIPVYIRATYAGVVYGLFYGIVKRAAADASLETLEIFSTDPVDSWRRTAEINVSAGVSRSISAFRGLILDALAEPSARRNLTTFEHEADTPFTGADQADSLTLLGSLDASTATIGYLLFDPSPSILYKYTTIARNARSSQATDETITDTFTGIGYEINEDVNVTDQRVTFAIRQIGPLATVWSSSDVPISVDNGELRTVWASWSDPLFSPVLVTTQTNSPTITTTFFSRSAKIDITGNAGGTTISQLDVTGTPAIVGDAQSVFESSAAGGWRVRGPDISADYVPTYAAADGLANWTVFHLGTFEPRLDLTVENRFPTQVQRQIGDRIVVSVLRVDPSSRSDLIRTVSTTVSLAANHWTTTYGLEPAGIPVVGGVFILDTTPLNNGTQKLGY